VRTLTEGGEIGRVESSSVVALARNNTGPTVMAPVDYFIERKIGGNVSTIAFGHSVELVTSGKKLSLSMIYFPHDVSFLT